MNQDSIDLQKTLSKKSLHNLWIDTYYSGRNNIIYDLVFEKIFHSIEISRGGKILDAGCGNGIHSIRLAKAGLGVTALDFSDEALKLAADNLKAQNKNNGISLKSGNLLNLEYENESFDYVLCWGVLMHIAELERALNELCRVLKIKGKLILAENNKNSIQTLLAYFFKKTFSLDTKIIDKDTRGIQFWYETKAGRFLVRKTNIKWLENYLSQNNLNLIQKFPGHFTSIYTRVNSQFFKNLIYLFNECWVKYVKIAKLAETNILIFEKFK